MTGSDTDFDRILARSKTKSAALQSQHNVFGQAPLHLAISKPRRLKKLLEAGMDPNAVDRDGVTPLMYAACYGEVESVLLLLKHNAQSFLCDQRYGREFIHHAISYGRVQVIEALIDVLRGQAGDNEATAIPSLSMQYYFMSGLHYDPDIDGHILNRLFELGADPDLKIGTASLVHFAARDTQVHRIFTAGFTSVDCQDEHGKTPLMKVASMYDYHAIEFLLSRGAPLDRQDRDGWTALHHLTQRKNFDQKHFDSRESSSGHEAEDMFRNWIDTIPCMHLLFSDGSGVFARDRCVCACSSSGCSAVTLALHNTAVPNEYFARGRLCGIPFDLLCVFRNRASAELPFFLNEVMRYRKFLESNTKHTCCRGHSHETRQLHAFRDYGNTRGHHPTAYATFNDSDVTVDKSTPALDVIALELTALLQVIESRLLKRHHDAIAKEQRQVSTSVHVDLRSNLTPPLMNRPRTVENS